MPEFNPFHRLDAGSSIFLKEANENGEGAGLWFQKSFSAKNALIGTRAYTEAGLYGNTGSPYWIVCKYN